METIETLRESNTKSPSTVISLCGPLFASPPSMLSKFILSPLYSAMYAVLGAPRGKIDKYTLSEDEYYALAEEYIYAQLQLKNPIDSQRVFEQIVSPRFPPAKFKRSAVLQGAILECANKHKEAIQLYDQLLSQTRGDYLPARKRKICCLISQQNYEAAIKECVALLDIASDADTWLVLCDLYGRLRDADRALYCAEELLMLDPMHPGYLTLLARLYVASNPTHADTLRVARKYAARACELCDGRDKDAVATLRMVIDRLDASKQPQQGKADEASLHEKLRQYCQQHARA
jgi:tetratricopeptide (TPR) repeat protein